MAMNGLNGGRVNIASCSLGGSKASLEAALEHVKIRKQFGNPLSSNQSVQFKLADMVIKIASSRLMVRHAALMLENKDVDAASWCGKF